MYIETKGIRKEFWCKLKITISSDGYAKRNVYKNSELYLIYFERSQQKLLRYES